MKVDAKLIKEYSEGLDVLYVEDDKILRDSVLKILKRFFNQVDVADDGACGLDMYKKRFDAEKTYDIVVTDINMPKMNGIELSRNIMQLKAEQHVIIVSAHNEVEYLQEAIEVGVSSFLTKPIKQEQFFFQLYKISKAIFERKIVDGYYKQLEDLVVDVADKKTSDAIREFKNDKEIIAKKWLESQQVRDTLIKNEIDPEFFAKHYAMKVVEYFIDALSKNEKSQRCPVMESLIRFFGAKNISLESIFVVCSNFKNTVVKHLFSKSFDVELYDKFSAIINANFVSIITMYFKEKGIETQEDIDEEQSVENLEESEDSIDYSEYILDGDLLDFKEFEIEIENKAIAITMSQDKSLNTIDELSDHIITYGDKLCSYHMFGELGGAITRLGQCIKDNASDLSGDNQRIDNMAVSLEGIVNDLILWRKEVIDKNNPNHKFLNASFLSNVDMIVSIIEKEENTDSEDIEFF